MKLKEQYLDALIYIPIEWRDTLGRFIDPRLYPYLSKKFPELFELEPPKKTTKNDIRFNDTKLNTNDNDTTESSIVGNE